MKLHRALILAAAPILAATAVHAETDSHEVQQSIYDVVRGQPDSTLRESRSSLREGRPSPQEGRSSLRDEGWSLEQYRSGN